MLSSEELRILLLSLQVASVGTLIFFPIGLGVSWLLAKSSMRGKLALDILVSFPLVLPPVITGYLLLLLMGRHGPIGGLLYRFLGIEIVFTWVVAALAAGLVSLPLMVRAMEVAMAGVEPRLERVARSLGAGPWRAFFSVTLPLASRGILAGVLLAFARGLGEFGATIVVAGNIPGKTQTLSLAVFSRVETGDGTGAVRLIVVSLALALISLAIHQQLARRTVR